MNDTLYFYFSSVNRMSQNMPKLDLETSEEKYSHFLSTLAHVVQTVSMAYLQFDTLVQFKGQIYLTVDTDMTEFLLDEQISKSPDEKVSFVSKSSSKKPDEAKSAACGGALEDEDGDAGNQNIDSYDTSPDYADCVATNKYPNSGNSIYESYPNHNTNSYNCSKQDTFSNTYTHNDVMFISPQISKEACHIGSAVQNTVLSPNLSSVSQSKPLYSSNSFQIDDIPEEQGNCVENDVFVSEKNPQKIPSHPETSASESNTEGGMFYSYFFNQSLIFG